MQATAATPQASDEAVLARRLGMFVGFLMQTQARDIVELASDFELSFSQMKSLHALRNAPEPVTVKELGDTLGLSLGAMSRAADGLVQRGLVGRVEDAEDRRMKRLSLTKAGDELVTKMREARMSGFEAFVATLSSKERAQLSKAVEPILARDDVADFCGGAR
jgi:DNA-binding MarR family transcriptional regulator